LQGRRLWVPVGAALGLPLLAHLYFFGYAIYPIAERSLIAGEPFPRETGAAILALRGRDRDYEVILRQLGRPDWEELKRYDWIDDGLPDVHWQAACVELLAKRDEAWAAARLSELILERPNDRILAASLTLFAAQRRYELAPMIASEALHRAHDTRSR
jgi:hypothetical protein